MKYRNLGRNNIQVSEISLGCEGFNGKNEAETLELLKYAYDQGINFIDLYSSNPEVRSNLGQAIKELGIREKFIIEAHLCTTWANEQYERTRNLEKTKEAFEDLLERLQTTYIDVGMIHYVDAEDDFEKVFNGEIIEFAKQLKEEGKIKSIGLSSHNPIIAKKAVETGLIDVLLFSINPCYDIQPATENCNDLWDEKNYEDVEFKIDKDREELYELCEKQNVGITVMKCYGGGDLLDSSLSPFKVALTPIQCINYCLTRPGVSAVMLGIKNKEQIDAAVKFENATVQEKDYGSILGRLPRSDFDGKCVYCGHCAPCTVGIDIASINKYTALVKAEKEIPETVREHYKALKHHASECIGCGRCERNCPFHVSIIQKMDEAVKIFGY